VLGNSLFAWSAALAELGRAVAAIAPNATFPKSRLNMLRSLNILRLLLPASLAGRSIQIIAQDLSTLHYEFHALKLGDISQGIATDGDEVGELAAFDGADVGLPAHHLRVHNGRSPDNLRGSHTELDHVFELSHLCAVR